MLETASTWAETTRKDLKLVSFDRGALPHFVYLSIDTDGIHMIKWTRPSPSIFSKCKRSKAGRWESLGTRINNKYACAFVLVLKVIGTVCLYGCYECILIKAHPAVATQHMPSGLSNTDY